MRGLGEQQQHALTWILGAGGAVVAPGKDRVLLSLTRRGLLRRSATTERPSIDDLRAYGHAKRGRNVGRGWRRWSLTDTGREAAEGIG